MVSYYRERTSHKNDSKRIATFIPVILVVSSNFYTSSTCTGFHDITFGNIDVNILVHSVYEYGSTCLLLKTLKLLKKLLLVLLEMFLNC